MATLPTRLLILLLSAWVVGCPPTLDDDDATGDDDHATGDDDDATADDDDDVCTAADFPLVLEARDDNGVAGMQFGVGTSITLVGVLTNDCSNTITVETTSGCLLQPWTLNSSNGMGEARGCDDAITTWTWEPGQSLEDAVPIGTMQPALWTWTAGFVEGQSQTLSFEVVAPPPPPG